MSDSGGQRYIGGQEGATPQPYSVNYGHPCGQQQMGQPYWGQPQPYTQQPYGQHPFAQQQPYGQPQTYTQQPYTQQPCAQQPYAQSQAPYAQSQPYSAPQPYAAQPYFQQQPYAQQTYGQTQAPYAPRPYSTSQQSQIPLQSNLPPPLPSQRCPPASRKIKTGQKDVEGEFKCVFCDVEYKVERYYDQHCKNHIPCKYDGCDWECTPKLMPDHVKVKHLGLTLEPKKDAVLPDGYEGTGFKDVDVKFQGKSYGKFSIPLGNDEEDTKKWLAERRKKFPTRKNVIEKIAREEKGKEERKSLVEDNGFWGGSGGERQPLDRDPDAWKLTKAGQYSRLCQHFMGKGCRKGAECIDVHDNVARTCLQERRKAQNTNKRVLEETFGKAAKGTGGGGKKRRTGEGVLAKLLEGEQRREEDLTLAAIRYLVEVNFYQKAKAKEDEK